MKAAKIRFSDSGCMTQETRKNKYKTNRNKRRQVSMPVTRVLRRESVRIRIEPAQSQNVGFGLEIQGGLGALE